jgi:signal recognition particle GTPase
VGVCVYFENQLEEEGPMSANAKETKYIKNQVPDEERCLFTTNHGHRCRNPHLGNATRHCFLHEGRNQKVDEAEAQAVSEQLLAKNVGLATRDDVNRITSQLYTMVAEKRVSRQDGSLLAYIASVLLQTITPVRRKAIASERVEFAESVAEPIPATREEFNRKVAERFAREPQMPGRTDNPYMYPTKLR